MVTATRKTDAYLDEDEDFEDGVCKPGESIRCPLYLCDATQRAIAFDAGDHQPHFARAADAALERRRTEARDAMICRR
jgi:hypothetical protein